MCVLHVPYPVLYQQKFVMWQCGDGVRCLCIDRWNKAIRKQTLQPEKAIHEDPCTHTHGHTHTHTHTHTQAHSQSPLNSNIHTNYPCSQTYTQKTHTHTHRHAKKHAHSHIFLALKHAHTNIQIINADYTLIDKSSG